MARRGRPLALPPAGRNDRPDRRRRAIDTRGDRTLGTLGGAAVGALAGRAIERDSGNRRCR